MGDQQAPIGEVFYIEGASSYKQDSGALNYSAHHTAGSNTQASYHHINYIR